jgi:anti-anti-sigma factor
MTDPGVVVRSVGAAVVAALPAEIDLLNADEIMERLDSLISERPSMLILDLTQTTFCDSAGAATLIHAYKKAAAAGIPLRLAASKSVARTLTLLAVDRLASIYPTVEVAIESVAAGSSSAPARSRRCATDPAASAADGAASP